MVTGMRDAHGEIVRSRIWRRCDQCGLETAQINRHFNKTGHLTSTAVRWDEPHNYRSAHHLVIAVRGYARERECACGEPATQWALRAELHHFGELSWSPDPDDYAAMCERCHKHQDWPADKWREVVRKASAAAGSRGGISLRDKRRLDPELDAKIRAVVQANGRLVYEQRKGLFKPTET